MFGGTNVLVLTKNMILQDVTVTLEGPYSCKKGSVVRTMWDSALLVL